MKTPFIVVSLCLASASVSAGPDFVTATPRGHDLVASNGTRDVLPWDDIVFTFDSATLSESSLGQLDAAARYLRIRRDVFLVVEGYTDHVGSTAYNIDLSTRRAQAVRKALLQRGVPSDRMVLGIFGESAADPAGNPLDRRAIIYATKTPVREVVASLLDKRLALTVVWTHGETLSTQERSPRYVASRR